MWTNSKFKAWLEEINISDLSQEQLKQEASKFCNKFGKVNKKTVFRCVEDFLKTEKKELTKASLIIFKEKGGTEGKMKGRFDVPPQNYCPRDFKAFSLAEENLAKEEKEDLHANYNLARMVIINDLERLPLLMVNDVTPEVYLWVITISVSVWPICHPWIHTLHKLSLRY